MADANLIDGHDADWWKEQRDRLKAEVDDLAPKLTAATTRVKELEAQVVELTAKRDAELAAVRDENAKLKSLAAERRAALADVMRVIAVAHEKIGPLLTE